MTHGSTKRRRGQRVTLVLIVVQALLCAAAAEVTSRAFWSYRYSIPFLHPSRILYAYYPQLRRIDTLHPSRTDEFYDILLLGGSTLHKDWGEVEQSLLEQMALAGHHNVRIFNLAVRAHTSRDSWLKYAALGQARFELVIVYDGLNEARANNAPPEIFQEDYSHYAWYEIVNALAPYHGAASFALPYTLRYLTLSLKSVLWKNHYVPVNDPRPDWVEYGRQPRSAVPFEHNLRKILDLASARGDRLMLMTFALYLPQDYSRQAFAGNRLDYVLNLRPIELWGRPEHVVATVAIHNEVVRRLAAEHHDVLFVDQARLMANSPESFNDPCHLTVMGSYKFVGHLLQVLLPTVEAARGR